MPRSEPIKKIRKRYRREWLLISVDEMNEKTTTPVKGHLLAHSPHRDDIYNTMMRRKELTLVTYSDDHLPAGYALAL